MKINDQLDLVERADGTWYIRSRRIDYRDPSKMSPAKRAFYAKFRAVAAQTKGSQGLIPYKGKMMPIASVLMAEGMAGTIDAQHVDYHVIRRQRLWDLLERSGSVLVQAWGRIVAVVQPS